MITLIGLQCINCNHVWYRTPGDDQDEPTLRGVGRREIEAGPCPRCNSFELHAWEVAKDGVRAG